jgi:arylsulfatase A-like enzyme
VLNVDFAPTILDLAGAPIPGDVQGRSFLPLLEGNSPADWRKSMYYRYWMHLADHGVPAHYGVRTDRHKLIHYYGQPLGTKGSVDRPTPPEWELFDLETDPDELRNLYGDPAHAAIQSQMLAELQRLRQELGDDR